MLGLIRTCANKTALSISALSGWKSPKQSCAMIKAVPAYDCRDISASVAVGETRCLALRKQFCYIQVLIFSTLPSRRLLLK